MAEKREVFTILEDDTTAEGVKLPARAAGDAAAGNHIPAMVAKDNSGDYQLIQMRGIGSAVAGDHVASVVAEDDTGYQLIRLRAEGDTVSGNELPVLPAKDASGNWAHIPLNADGEIPVAINSGTPKQGSATVTSTALGVADTVVNVVLSASKNYEKIQALLASTFTVTWEFFKVDDAGGTPVETSLGIKCITGAGQFSQMIDFEDFRFASAATGIQHLRVKGSQLFGALTDKHATVTVIERP